jgi:hypothetical protein
LAFERAAPETSGARGVAAAGTAPAQQAQVYAGGAPAQTVLIAPISR